MTNTTKAPTPLKIARQERDAALATLSLYKQLHRWAALGKTPDITRKWSGHLECDEHDSAYNLQVEIRWWGSCRSDEGIVEIVAVDSEDEGCSNVEVCGAIDLRAAVRESSYLAPWRFTVANMLAIGLTDREAEAARYASTASPKRNRWNLED